MKFLTYTLLSLFTLQIFAQQDSCAPCSKVIFLVDNSGSMGQMAYTEARNAVIQISTDILNQEPKTEIAVVQYGTAATMIPIHLYNVSVPYTSNISHLYSWGRAFYGEDHLPGSLGQMRIDGIFDRPQVGDTMPNLFINTCEVKFIIFTDAYVEGSCCSYLTNTGDALFAYPYYGEYNFLKNKYNAEIFVYHIPIDSFAQASGAAISSVGGNYVGPIDSNPGDPQGNMVIPRFYFNNGFSFIPTNAQINLMVSEAFVEICESKQSISEIVVPNVFTPNGDGNNDVFEILKKNIASIDVEIYNRWGQLLISWDDMGYVWDGRTLAGELVPDGTYFYIAKATGADGVVYLKKGHLSIFH